MIETAERRDGLHCVYGTCQGLPCNPGCSFTMTCVSDLEILRRQETTAAAGAKIAQVRRRLAGMVALGDQKTDDEMYELAVGLWQTAKLALQELDA